MGARIAAVILLSTLFSYFHMLHTLRAEALVQLEQHVSERGQREESIFLLAQDNHAFLSKALVERIRDLSHEDPSARFDELFVRMPDGSVRNRPEGFDGTRMVQVFIPPQVVLDTAFRTRLLAAYDVLRWYSPALHVRFVTTFMILPEGVIMGYAPDLPRWTRDLDASYPATAAEYFTISRPEHNPRRQTAWTGVFQEVLSRTWLAAVSTPVDLDGRHIATIGHSVFLNELMARTRNEHLPGAYNILFRDDGQLIAHPSLKQNGSGTAYNILSTAGQPGAEASHLGSQEEEARLRDLFEWARAREPGQTVLELPETGEYVAVTRLRGPGWNFATVLPGHVVSRPAFQAARIVLLLGVVSLLLELAIMYWVLQRQITRPLVAFTEATDKVAAGDFQVGLDTSRGDELGQLARAFQLMAGEVQRREEALREANEGLELRVEERTRELKEVHLELVQTARRAGMAEIATNVLHNVGNVLNSVYTSAQLARERMGGMRLEQVGRVAELLEERRTELSTFLTQDERGKNVLPFLSRLGANLLEERQRITTLLDDVGRYTEHVGDIVKVQQNYARTPRIQEPVQLAGLVEDALRINEAGLLRHQVKVQRHLAELPPVLADKHKALMILVNLVSNAKYAMDAVPAGERIVTVTLERTANEQVRIAIHDNGMGIAPEMLNRIFQYGFTTRDEGHGFGLHSSALAAQEMGGSLTVHSDGPGKGATFTLELPYVLAVEAA
ncbi:histidine kinase [Archangium violaceum Cb vi76]|uniref:histidine kinase n=2 Tax=Archangium violaceum TaxID=83451 RepID=A0A084SJR7_9BACT|nr:histidine kinase [Archangium violaceum Cb vi76]